MEIGDNARTCVVLGGRGFIGRSLVLELLQFGDWIVRVADSPHSLKLLPSEQDSLLSQALSSGRASYFHLDVLDETLIIKAIQGSSVVFYTDVTLEELDFYNCYMILVQGAKNVLKVCRECKVKRLIYNSSADVVFDGSSDIRNGDESLQCPWKFQDMLSDLKAQAEALVLLANNNDGPLTCALRPSIVYGPGETDLVPLLVNRAKSGWAKYIVGIGENMSDFTYVDNVARAHICAEEALVSRAASVAGKAFFITNLEPMKLWEFVSLMVEEFGYLRPSVKLPDIIVWYILLLVRWKHEKLGTIKLNRSSSDPYMFHLATRTRVFNCTAAKTYLGYSPIVSVRDGIMLTAESFSHLASDSPFNKYVEFTEESKVDKLLGGGKVAEILLWRDEKITFAYFLALATLFDWFFLLKRNFISSAAELLVLITIYLHSYIFLPPTIFGITVPRISSSSFQISETGVKCSITALTHRWNTWARAVKCLARGDDWNTFIKGNPLVPLIPLGRPLGEVVWGMAGPLYLLALCLSHSVNLVMGGVLVFSFTCFFIYEQYESLIDGSAILFRLGVQELNALLRRQLPPAVLYVFKGGKSNLRRRDHFTKFCC